MIDLGTLNPQQRLAVETIHGPVLILAGAGTGKTRVITFRIAHLVEQGIPPGHILAVTFTNKAAREMLERVRGLIPSRKRADKTDRPTVCTFHSLCVRILREHIGRLGYKPNFVIYDESDQLSAMRKVLSRISSRGEKADPHLFLQLLSKAKNGASRCGRVSEDEAFVLQHIQPRYEAALKACNAVDFDDLLLLALRLFREHPEVLAACRDRFRYVMVDEYQDTNAAQFNLVQLLTNEHRNLCVVGDDDQSIYGWRGAEIANLLDLEKHFPEVKVVKLEQNYRSTNIILKAANAVIKNNLRRRGKTLWSKQGDGQLITMNAFMNETEEADAVVDSIEVNRMGKGIPWKDHAILFRTNLQSRPIETALRKAGIKYRLIGGQSFFDRREIKDALSYLKTFINPHDDVSLLRIANTPSRGLSEGTMERLLSASQEHKCSVFTAMGLEEVRAQFLKRAELAIEAFHTLIQTAKYDLESVPATQAGGWVDRFLGEQRYFDELKNSEKEVEAGESRVRNVRELLISLDDRSEASEANATSRINDFLEEVSLDREREEDKEADGNLVTLITMHSCKGLEFPHVFIVGLEDGLLPHTRSKEEGTIDEERRLFYVAITRAMRSLTLSHVETRKKYGDVVSCHPSPFLSELPEDLLQNGEAKGPIAPEAGKNWFANMKAMIDPDAS